MDLVNLEDAAKTLNISMIELWRSINTGKIRAEKNGNEFFISKEEIEVFANRMRVERGEINKAKAEEEGNLSITPAKKPPSRIRSMRHAQIIPGINSRVMEAIVAISHDLDRISELKEVISENARQWLGFIEKIEEEGVTDLRTAMELLLIDEALKNLNTRRSLFLRLMNGTAMVLLPLPPHLSDAFLEIAQNDRVFHTDRNLPPHLRHTYFPQIEVIPLAQLQNLMRGVEAVILEGYLEHEHIYVRDTASNVVYLLSSMGLKHIFVHSIPHIPPQARFVELIVNETDITITSI